MKKNLVRTALAVAALGVAGTAQAVPVYFDFTGTITSSTVSPPDGSTGGALSGGFNFETDRLFEAPPIISGQTTQYAFVDWQPSDLSEPLAFLNFGGGNLSWPNYESSYSIITFFEGCSVSGCPPQTSEAFSLQALSGDVWSPDFTGTMHTQFLFFMSSAETRLPDSPYFENFDYFEPEDVAPTSIVTLPLYALIGLFSETTSSCVNGACATIEDRQYTFSVDSVSRGVGARSVPEPGTLGLFGVALAGMFFLRRRQTALLQR
jgi:hypothetical protein